MDEEETLEDFWNEVLDTMHRQLQETREQKADRWERIARHAGMTDDEISSLRAEILGRLN